MTEMWQSMAAIISVAENERNIEKRSGIKQRNNGVAASSNNQHHHIKASMA